MLTGKHPNGKVHCSSEELDGLGWEAMQKHTQEVSHLENCSKGRALIKDTDTTFIVKRLVFVLYILLGSESCSEYDSCYKHWVSNARYSFLTSRQVTSN